jgi:pimeloyl-ACP methyl ester carboxylesterase
MKHLACVVILVSLAASAGEKGEISSSVDGALRKLEVNGAELHYVAMGNGPAIVFVHGGLADYRELLPVARQLEGRYSAIFYSRRHSYPNRDNPVSLDHSPISEADDLAALIEELGLQPAHVVGVSYGASTSLFLALRHPGLARSLTIVEPPLVSWLPGIAGGQAVYDDFYGRLVTPVRAAFQAGDRDGAFRLTLEYFVGPGALEQVPPEILARFRLNLRDWEVMFKSRDVLPDIPAADLRKLDLPVLMLSGGTSYEIGKLVDAELERTLPKVRRVVIPEGTHDACVEKPDMCAREIGTFLDGLAD